MKLRHWALYYGMSAEEFAKRKNEQGKEGYKLTAESRSKIDGEQLFTAIWYKN